MIQSLEWAVEQHCGTQ